MIIFKLLNKSHENYIKREEKIQMLKEPEKNVLKIKSERDKEKITNCTFFVRK